jgi:chemotaxis protein MotB
MSVADAGGRPHEIIIVRHGGGDHEEGHHGGVWKIAFADFMTAMMCFFLVMWLINAANEQTKAAVASYFNPVKLIDRNSSRKGLEDVGDGPNAIGSETEKPQSPEAKAGIEGRAKGGPQNIRDSQDAKDTKNYSDEHLFADPYAVLAEIAGETGVKQNISSAGDGGAQTAGPATGASGGESYRDPFAPDFWTKQVEPPVETERIIETPAVESETAPTVKKQEAAKATKDNAEAAAKADAANQETIAGYKPTQPDKPLAELFRHAEEQEGKPAQKKNVEKTEEPRAKDEKPTNAAVEKAKQITQEIARAMGTGDKLGNGLEVVATDKGVTISVTDEFDFGMFEIGSALPRRELVLAMEKIGKVLSSERGAITIDGHTDGRLFRSAAYDNWRLSTARAHSAYYMLVRAGLDEKRVKEVGGFADRKLKLAADPLSAANRRIEILLEVDG